MLAPSPFILLIIIVMKIVILLRGRYKKEVYELAVKYQEHPDNTDEVVYYLLMYGYGFSSCSYMETFDV